MNRINIWKQYILKNHPVLWMSGIHLILPLLCLIFIAGFAYGYSFNYTQSLSGMFAFVTVASVIALIIIVIWQYFRFMKEVTFRQLVKYYGLCVAVYLSTIVAFSSPVIGFEKKLAGSNERVIKEQLVNYQVYVLARTLQPFYKQDSCSFKAWQSCNPGLIFFYPTDWEINRMLEQCPGAKKHPLLFRESITDSLSRYGFLRGDAGATVFSQALADTARAMPDTASVRAIEDTVIQTYSTDKTAEQALAEGRERQLQKMTNINASGDMYFPIKVRLESINRAAKLVADDSVGYFYHRYVEPQAAFTKDFKMETGRYIAKFDSADLNEEAHRQFNNIFAAQVSALRDNFEFKQRGSYGNLLGLIILIVLISALSILVITARFRIEALLSPVATLLCWAVLILLQQQIDPEDRESLALTMIFVAVGAIIIYWVRDMNIRSVNWLRSLLLHVANLSTLFLQYIVFLYLDSEVFHSSQISLVYPLVLGLISLLLNVFFVYQYYRHMRLPMRNR